MATDDPSTLLISSLQDCVRNLLRERGWTYRDLSDALDVSEPTIKRWMTATDLSVSRIGRIAGAFGMTAFELLRRAEEGDERTFTLDPAIEAALVGDPDAHLAWDALRMGRSPEAVRAHYGHAHPHWLRLLGRLEAWGLVERHPDDRVRLLHVGIHNWLPGGPLVDAHKERRLVWVEEAWARKGPPAVMQSATRVVGPDFFELAGDELRRLAHTWRNRAWRDQVAVSPEQQSRVRWLLVVGEAPEWPTLE